MKAVHHQIRDAREATGMGVVELAGRLGISRNALYLIESGKNDPSLKTMIAICYVLKCKIVIGDW